MAQPSLLVCATANTSAVARVSAIQRAGAAKVAVAEPGPGLRHLDVF
jgi:hypothetical protein